jgi:1-aminocyclopropane-1-carboxylate deaminase/D-cysteine desulfhydrase-like pyridoxal-dependent ACC family enzyme
MREPPPLLDLPRVPLLYGPTPLQPMPRLSAALGGRVDLWIKREDLGPIPFSGNKLRNLEFLLGAADAEGADAIVTAGRRWSNHCRLAAAAGSRLGLDVHTVLSGPAGERSPNVELIELFGGTVHQAATADRAEREALVERVAGDLRSAGRRVKVIPVGGSDAAGAWGQVLAGVEVTEQASSRGFVPDSIVLATATGGTQAGLIVGTGLARRASTAEPRDEPRILGVVVAHTAGELRPAIERLAGELRGPAGRIATEQAVDLDDSQIGAGYGVPSEASAEAAGLLARTEGILVDPIYGAKGLAALIERVRGGAIDGQRVIFWHGGGLPSPFETGVGPDLR